MNNLKKGIEKNTIYLSDGGLETTLIFHQGIQLNHFASFELLKSESGKDALREYYIPYLDLALNRELHFIMESPTWRANSDWARLLGYDENELKEINREAIRLICDLVHEHVIPSERVLISGNMGPRGDGYKAENCMTAEEAMQYHLPQIECFDEESVDLITAMTLTYSDEAIGIVRAAQMHKLPVVISFTVETNGLLPNMESLKEAIQKTDAATETYVSHFMINCAHPDHFKHMLSQGEEWIRRIKGIRANASTLSHAELDGSETLDSGDKDLLADGYKKLQAILPELQVIGGCCGTDHSHMEALCDKLLLESNNT